MLNKRIISLVLFMAIVALAQTPQPAPAAQPAPTAQPAPAEPASVEQAVAPAAVESDPAAPAPAFVAEPMPKVEEKKESEASTISVFVKSPEEIKALQDDLKSLQTMVGGSNPEIEALLQKANRIAQMNDRCSMVSINEVLDTACGYFYEVELPAFENEYMELTGEVRLGSMRMATTLEERTQQLMSCSEALASIVVPREQLLRLKGNVYLEPINFAGDFDAEYRFSLSYDPTRMSQQERLANLWLSKCGDIVLRQTHEEFAPMFIASLKMKNDSLKKAGSNVKLMMNKKSLAVKVAMRRSAKGAYFLNGNKLFSRELSSKDTQSHLVFDLKNKKAVMELGLDAVIEDFKGRQVFKGLKKTDMIGRWMWDNDKNFPETAANDDSEKMTAEDSLAIQRGLDYYDDEYEENSQKAKDAVADAAKPEGEGLSIHWIPFAISSAILVGGGIMAVIFNKKAKDESEAYQAELDAFNASVEDGSVGSSPEDTGYSAHKDNVSKYQKLRTVGYGLAIAGGLGIGLSILF